NLLSHLANHCTREIGRECLRQINNDRTFMKAHYLLQQLCLRINHHLGVFYLENFLIQKYLMFLNGSASLQIENNDNFENRVNHYLENEDCNLEDGNNDEETKDDVKTNNDNCNLNNISKKK
ncbi:4524_t:CDS:2, partial [Entrophospora sp. SA101]